jgi:hypothetical protein
MCLDEMLQQSRVVLAGSAAYDGRGLPVEVTRAETSSSSKQPQRNHHRHPSSPVLLGKGSAVERRRGSGLLGCPVYIVSFYNTS